MVNPTISISERTARRIERLLNRIEATNTVKYTASEQEAADFLGWEVSTLRNNISNGIIPAAAIVEMVNGKKRFRLEKLIK